MKNFRTGAKIEVFGYVGGIPELEFTPSGKKVCKMSIAIGGGQNIPADWYTGYAWEEDADVLNNMPLEKGDAVRLEGYPKMGAYISKKSGKAVADRRIMLNKISKFNEEGEELVLRLGVRSDKKEEVEEGPSKVVKERLDEIKKKLEEEEEDSGEEGNNGNKPKQLGMIKEEVIFDEESKDEKEIETKGKKK